MRAGGWAAATVQPSAAKWNFLGANDASFNDGTGIGASAITPEKLFTGTGTTWPWASWTPTLTNITLGAGTLACTFKQIGKTVQFEFRLTLGAGSSLAADPYFTLPVTSISYPAAYIPIIGAGVLFDTSTSGYFYGFAAWRSTTTALIVAQTSSGAHTSIIGASTTSPFGAAFATGDVISLIGTYQAA